MEFADVPLETRVEGGTHGDRRRTSHECLGRAQVLMCALRPRPASIPELPPPRPVWQKRGLASTPAERAEVVELLEEGWSVGQVAEATDWSVAQVRMWKGREVV